MKKNMKLNFMLVSGMLPRERRIIHHTLIRLSVREGMDILTLGL